MWYQMIPGNFFKDLENITICMKQRNLKLSFTQTLQRMLNPIAIWPGSHTVDLLESVSILNYNNCKSTSTSRLSLSLLQFFLSKSSNCNGRIWTNDLQITTRSLFLLLAIKLCEHKELYSISILVENTGNWQTEISCIFYTMYIWVIE